MAFSGTLVAPFFEIIASDPNLGRSVPEVGVILDASWVCEEAAALVPPPVAFSVKLLGVLTVTELVVGVWFSPPPFVPALAEASGKRFSNTPPEHERHVQSAGVPPLSPSQKTITSPDASEAICQYLDSSKLFPSKTFYSMRRWDPATQNLQTNRLI